MAYEDERTTMIYSSDGTEQGTIKSLIAKSWNAMPDLVESGRFTITIGNRPTYIKAAGQLYRIGVSAEIHAERNLYFMDLPLKEMEGFHDVHEGGIVARSFTTRIVPEEIVRSGRRVEAEDELAVPPFLQIAANQGRAE